MKTRLGVLDVVTHVPVCVSTEPCADTWSRVVHTYSPRHQQDSHDISDEDSTTSPQWDLDVLHSHFDDDDDDDDAGGSGGAVRGRYGRRYDPPDTVVIVERPSPSQRTPSHVTTSGSTVRHLSGVLAMLTALRTTAFPFHCFAARSSLVAPYSAAVLQ